ncbi:MAG TPA: carbamoyltransferase [Thermoanaerobaculia bacterium]|nr:carbamoyltransferase [Thermoanaerobaculia bacterium]
MNILGVSAYYHDSAACLVQDGAIVAAVQEERFTRKKNDHRFPSHSVDYVLRAGGIAIDDVDYLVFYDKPLLKFERLVSTYVGYAPRGIASFLKSMPLWLKEKLHMPREIRQLTGYKGKLLFSQHHEAHAASAFYPSPFEEAAIVCFDGVGEWATTSYWTGRGNRISPLQEIRFPHSIGLLYSAFTYYTGFKVNSGEYKVMGLAPYGRPKYAPLIYEHLIDLKDDGSFAMNLDYFNYAQGLTMTNEKFHRLFGGPPRDPESLLTQRDLDLAASIQVVTEEAMLRIARHVHAQTGMRNLCLAGGVALNCVGNGRILREGPFENIWIQPAAGDAGGSLGAALLTWHQYLGNARSLERPALSPSTDRDDDGLRARRSSLLDSQHGSYLGPDYTREEIESTLDKHGAKYCLLDDAKLIPAVARMMSEGAVIGWMSGRMEFGPRALGARSILGDARNPEMQKRMNLKIKYRESFRPFAPAVLAEHASEWFDLDVPSPYMLLVADVRDEHRIEMTEEQQALFGIDKLNVARSTIPAVTHIDYSARVQTVHRETNPRFHALLAEFHRVTGCPVVVNTSFNVRGEPIVCSPEDAYRCFMSTEMDALVIGQHLLLRAEQPALSTEMKRAFDLD